MPSNTKNFSKRVLTEFYNKSSSLGNEYRPETSSINEWFDSDKNTQPKMDVYYMEIPHIFYSGKQIEKRETLFKRILAIITSKRKGHTVEIFNQTGYSRFVVRNIAFELPHELKHISAAIKASEYIPDLEKNWDDDGASVIPNLIWTRAADFVIQYSKYLFEEHETIITKPEIDPCRDGSVDLFWETPDAQLLINIRNSIEPVAFYYGDLHTDLNSIKGGIPTDSISEHLVYWMKHLRIKA